MTAIGRDEGNAGDGSRDQGLGAGGNGRGGAGPDGAAPGQRGEQRSEAENVEELEGLARETLDLWQSRLASLTRDPENLALMSRWMSTLTHAGEAVAEGLQAFARDFASAAAADRQAGASTVDRKAGARDTSSAEAPFATPEAMSADAMPGGPEAAPAQGAETRNADHESVEAQHDRGATIDRPEGDRPEGDRPEGDRPEGESAAPGPTSAGAASRAGGAGVAELHQRIALLEERVRWLEAALWDATGRPR